MLTLVAMFTYYSDTVKWKKLIILPLCIILGSVSLDYYNEILGDPVNGRPEGTFLYISHAKVGNEVYLTASVKGKVKLYKFVSTEEEDKKLQEAGENTAKGVPQEGEFPPPSDSCLLYTSPSPRD